MIQKSVFIVSPSDFHTAAALLSVHTVAFRSSVLAPFPVVSLEFFMKRQLLSKSTNDMIVIRKTREVSILLGKQKCRILKEIRQRIADENDIPFVTQECRHRGECSGTCPRCESELRYLEQQLDRRAALGKRITVAALCAGIAFTGAGCVQDVPVITPLVKLPHMRLLFHLKNQSLKRARLLRLLIIPPRIPQLHREQTRSMLRSLNCPVWCRIERWISEK